MSENFWDHLGIDEAGMPIHLPIGLTVDESGPADESEIHHWGCWCNEDDCPLDKILRQASTLGGTQVMYCENDKCFTLLYQTTAIGLGDQNNCPGCGRMGRKKGDQDG